MEDRRIQHYNLTVVNLPAQPKMGSFKKPGLEHDPIWYDPKFWQRGKIYTPHANLNVSYIEQVAGLECPRHFDAHLTCAYNIVLEGDAPIVFDNESTTYTSALLDVSKHHMVPASSTRRLIFKIGVRDRSFAEVSDVLDAWFIAGDTVDCADLMRIISEC